MEEKIIYTDWHKCHGKSWAGIITPESFAHPAKFSRALIRRIYAHAIEQEYIAPGACVVDPFGGVALGALHAMQNGLHWVGVELEEKFVGLGRENIALWNTRYSELLPRWGTAMLLHGDSRELAAVLGGAGAVVSSPPFEGVQGFHDKNFSDRWGTKQSRTTECSDYGESDGQLGAMPTGDINAVISSPPYSGARIAQSGGGNENNMRRSTDTGRYGETEGQLGTMVVGSPPHGSYAAHGRSGPTDATMFEQPGKDGQTFACEDYGESPGQLGAMVLGSPPYAESLASDDPDKRGGLFRDPKRRDDKTLTAEYGDSVGQLGAMKAGAVVGSPPFSGSMVTSDDPKYAHKFHGDQGKYAERELKLHNEFPYMSPEWIEERKRQAKLERNIASLPESAKDPDYPTFWQAARTIMEQCYQILTPGSVAIWVLKAFVRKKAIVDFPGQWQQLGEACGFETVEVIRAWLVEDRGAQYDLFGGLDKRKVERKSFFRTIYEKKARAEKFWHDSVSRADKARHLWASRVQLWADYRDALTENYDIPPTKPTPKRIRSSAQMAAYVEAGEPDVEIDVAIDFEVVLVQRKPAPAV